ncbi:hypothetical protein PDL71_02165 [Lacibacter sp. MH-610]|uniref:hypothetical protein n=1 Tax=Lacibacter sp. MH-610 TaxID=3020883 RepID=UPI0038924DB9
MTHFFKLITATVLFMQYNSSPLLFNQKNHTMNMNGSSVDTVQTITITKVETPWYATRNMIIKRFEAAIPDYEKIPGLNAKSFSLSSSGSYFGGIYYWNSKQTAEAWFNPGWFETVKKKYKSPGEVLYYTVTGEEIVVQALTGKEKYWTVVSIGQKEINTAAQGLIKVSFVKNEKGSEGHISLWKTEEDARAYYHNSLSANEFFDTPVLLVHGK